MIQTWQVGLLTPYWTPSCKHLWVFLPWCYAVASAFGQKLDGSLWTQWNYLSVVILTFLTLKEWLSEPVVTSVRDKDLWFLKNTTNTTANRETENIRFMIKIYVITQKRKTLQITLKMLLYQLGTISKKFNIKLVWVIKPFYCYLHDSMCVCCCY